MNRVSLNTRYVSEEVLMEYETLSVNMSFLGKDKKVIAIVGCSQGDDSDEISLRLATTLAKMGHRTLLINANMREYCALENAQKDAGTQGLAHYLNGKSELKDIINMTDSKDLFITFAGAQTTAASELLSGGRFGVMIQAIKKIYDYVIINTPPAGKTIDATITARSCDGIIMAIKSGNNKRSLARRVKEQLERSKCPILGAVLIGEDTI